MHSFYEFFAGGGMVRAGLGEGWRCLFANDIDARKGAAYRANWGADALRIDDIGRIEVEALPGRADLVWGSFPCQDLSLAGVGAGLGGARSGTFYPFWSIVTRLIADGRGPRLIVLENVVGALTSHEGRDFQALCAGFAAAGYRYGALVIDAALFVPQSRPRLFMVGVRRDLTCRRPLLSPRPLAPFHPEALQRAVAGLDEAARDRLVWWNLPPPAARDTAFADLVQTDAPDLAWHTADQTRNLVAMMSVANLAKLAAASRDGRPRVGCLYRRTRREGGGAKLQRAEVRFDDLAGCLRTPAGGSSRQIVILVEGERVRTRLISARETARLMGLPDGYRLPETYNEAYHLTGDGVAVPVVRHLAEHLFEPILDGEAPQTAVAIG